MKFIEGKTYLFKYNLGKRFYIVTASSIKKLRFKHTFKLLKSNSSLLVKKDIIGFNDYELPNYTIKEINQCQKLALTL